MTKSYQGQTINAHQDDSGTMPRVNTGTVMSSSCIFEYCDKERKKKGKDKGRNKSIPFFV